MDPLPIELTRNIMSSLNKDTILECMKVCRSWYSGLSHLYYYKVRIISYHKRFLEQTEKTRIDGKKIGDFVRSITFSSPYPPMFELLDKHEFCRLINNLPYLETIQFNDGIDWYVKYIESIQIDKLKHIQEVTVHGVSKDIRGTHVPINIILKDRITKLYLDDMDIILARRALGNFDDILKTLSTFEKLKHLEIYTKIGPLNNYLLALLNSCTKLTSLRFKSDSSCSLSAEKGVTLPNLTSLHLNIENGLNYESLDYIMTYLPNLKELKLSPFCTRSRQPSIFDLTTERAQNFLKYLKSRTRFEFQERKIYDNRNYRRSLFLLQFQPPPELPPIGHRYCVQDKPFWSYIHKLVGEGYTCNLKIFVEGQHTNYEIIVNVDRQRQIINIENAWIKNSSANEDWINTIDFLTFVSITIVDKHSSSYFEEHKKFERHDGITIPMLNFLKRTHKKHSTHLYLKKMVKGQPINITYTFLDMETFYHKQKQFTQQHPLQSQIKQRGNTTLVECKDDPLISDELIKSIKHIQSALGDKVLEKMHSIFDIEYFVGCK